MCGIAGIYSTSEDLRGEMLACISRKMLSALRLRGPDDEGVWLSPDGQLAFAHTRLSIIDLSPAGHQPMCDSSGKHWITYNGEIFNSPELRQTLSGYRFRSTSDTETLIALLVREGGGVLPKLRGMFAFGWWDDAAGTLTLARDAYGIKPLYYYVSGSLVLFASELRALLATGLIPRKLDRSGVASYLASGAVSSPATIIEGVRCLEPGHLASFAREGGGLRMDERAWCCAPAEKPAPRSREEAVKQFGGILSESVKAHLLSDVPVGLFLSGGIDSSILATLMKNGTEEALRTFTVTFDEHEFSESSHAQKIAGVLGAVHTEIRVPESRIVKTLPRALKSLDQPSIDGVNTWVISGAIREAGIKVAISGLGSDELFGGYPSFRRLRQIRRAAVLPGSLRRKLAEMGASVWRGSRHEKFWRLLSSNASPSATYTISRQVFTDPETQMLVIGSVEFPQPDDSDTGDPINEMSRLERSGYMANMLLRDTDCMSMAHGLEVRVPFVDPAVIAYVDRLPGDWKTDGGRPKPFLLDAVGKSLPETIWRRRKMGFTFPFQVWLQSVLRKDVEDLLNDAGACGNIGLNHDAVSAVWQAFLAHPQRELWTRTWSLYVLMLWCRNNGVSA